MQHRPLDILIVDDSRADVCLMREALNNTGVPYRLSVSPSAEDACEILSRRGAHKDARCPDLILLDLNLPDMSGHEVLLRIKSSPDTQMIPVIIMSTSRAERDVRRAYNGYANCYIVKPSTLDELYRIAGAIEYFWTHIAVLPPKAV